MYLVITICDRKSFFIKKNDFFIQKNILKMKYSTIVITDKDLGISRDNKIPWEKIEVYEKYFHLLTKNKILLLGRQK